MKESDFQIILDHATSTTTERVLADYIRKHKRKMTNADFLINLVATAAGILALVVARAKMK